jgi:hypothetical protein
MRKENIKKYCVTCEHRTRLDDRGEKVFAEKGHLIAYVRCYGYSNKGLKLNSMKEYMCPMIEDAKASLKRLDIEQKVKRLETCDKNLKKLLERKAELEEELEKLRNS